MIINVNKTNITDAAKVYMESWKDSHKDICSSEFIEKHDLNYMINFLKEKKKLGYDIFIDYIDKEPVGVVGINRKMKKSVSFIFLRKNREKDSELSFLNLLFQNAKILI